MKSTPITKPTNPMNARRTHAATTHDVIVFLGPTMPIEKAQQMFPVACYFPPVRCGDILCVMRLQPKMLVIIDGYFEHTAAVWHKEILYAMSQGVTVYGASSMGALRAAELHPFGMIGVGDVFEQYASGQLEDDDEVAVLHQDAVHGYAPITDAMVNIRSTVAEAISQSVVMHTTGDAILNAAKILPYSERTLQQACQDAISQDMSVERLNHFLAWVESGGWIDQKQQDACAVLERVADDITRDHAVCNAKQSPLVSLSLSHTACLRALQRMVSSEPFVYHHDFLPIPEKVALVARLFPETYRLTKRLSRLMAIVQSLTNQLPDNNIVYPYTFGEVVYSDAWCAQNDCVESIDAFRHRMQQLASITGFSPNAALSSSIQQHMCHLLRLRSDEYCMMRQKSLEEDGEGGEEAVLTCLERHHADIYRALLYTAYLWEVIHQAADQADLYLSDTKAQEYLALFCARRGLQTHEQLAQWMQDRDLDQAGLMRLIEMTLRFDYIVKSNNFDAIGAVESADAKVWWLLDALYVLDAYQTAKQAMQHPEECLSRLEALQASIAKQDSHWLYSLDFKQGVDEFYSFSELLKKLTK